jgi:hypothetical protein
MINSVALRCFTEPHRGLAEQRGQRCASGSRERRTCAMCKGHKRGGWNRWKDREFALLKEFEREKLNRRR